MKLFADFLDNIHVTWPSLGLKSWLFFMAMQQKVVHFKAGSPTGHWAGESEEFEGWRLRDIRGWHLNTLQLTVDEGEESKSWSGIEKSKLPTEGNWSAFSENNTLSFRRLFSNAQKWVSGFMLLLPSLAGRGKQSFTSHRWEVGSGHGQHRHYKKRTGKGSPWSWLGGTQLAV